MSEDEETVAQGGAVSQVRYSVEIYTWKEGSFGQTRERVFRHTINVVTVEQIKALAVKP